MKAFFSIMVVASVILAVQQTCGAEGQGKPLEVKIVATYYPPSSFSKHLLFYQAGSPLTLSCEVEDVDEEEVIYEWASTCSGSCFVRGGTTKTVSTRYLHSYDSGVHTCAVHTHSYTGNATIIVSVVGAGIYIESTDTVLSNNSLISTSELHQNMPSFRCLSGSSKSRVGRLIDPLGNDITFSTSDPFFISRGGQHDPGTLYIRSLREFEPTDSGIYIYRTPDENGNIVDINVGLYHYTTSSAPILLDFLFSHTESPYIFTCVSSLSPPTEVIWEVDGERIYFNDSYSDYDFTQTLVNCTTSTYYNTLSINGTIDDVIGEYSCTVVNSLGSSNTLTKTIKVLEVSGHEDPLIVGVSRRINCKTYLDVTKMEWLLEGIVYPVEKRDDGGQELVMTLDPKNTDLDGTMFTCRIITARGITLEEAIIINVRELENSVSITGPPNPLPVGEKYFLNCIVVSDFTPTVQWLDPNNQVITTTGTSVRTDNPVTNGNTTYVGLHFDSIHTSQGGTYTCTSTVSKTGSFKKETRDLQVQITASNVSIVQSQTAFLSEQVELTCITTFFDPFVDTPVYVTHDWTTPSGVVITERGSAITGSYQQYRSTLSFSSLQSSDSGTYICASTVNDSLSEYVTSDTMSTWTSLNTNIRVDIEITYSSPDQYPDYSPPNYRAASSVTLRCVATGTTGGVSYHWSSTCRSDCFAYSTTAQTISENMLRSRDAGVHTCTVTDGAGNTGTNSTTMNIVGAGIYVIYSRGTGTSVNSQTVQPNNSYAIVDTGGSNRYCNSYRFEMYCCSNYSSSRASFTLPNNAVINSNYGNIRYDRYTGSDTYAGCTYFYYYYRYSRHFYLNYPGVHTCNIGDSRGNNIAVSIGLYSEGFNYLPSIYQLRQTNTGTDHTVKLICRSYRAPPTNITWFRNDEVLDIDGNSTEMTIFGGSRSSSYFDIVLTIIYDSVDSVVGTYTCQTANKFGISSKEIVIQDISVIIEVTYSPPDQYPDYSPPDQYPDYSPPDQYPDYSPPNYRAATSVTLRCIAIGTNNSLSYRWSSTCRSGCFAYSSTAQTISKNMLTSHDAGVHTCTVTDGSGNIGTDSITMNIVGAGIYVIYSLGTGTSVSSQTAQPNNSYAIVDTRTSNRYSDNRFEMFCCSNSSSSRGTFTLPNNAVISGNYGNIRYNRYTGSHTYAGCTQFYYYYYYNNYLYIDSGIYTCNIGDSRGNNIAVSIGLYSEGFRALPSISLIQQVNSGMDHTAKIICASQSVPPTNITWFRNDEILDIDGNSTEMTVSVTNRQLSYFDITLIITYDSPNEEIGTYYTCQTANNFGMDSEIIEFQDMQIQCSSDEFIVGQYVRCSCTGYLDPISIEWYQGNTSLEQSFVNTSSITIPVTTDNEGAVYTCLMTSFWSTHQEMFILNTTVPYYWANVYINTSIESALHGSEYTLECIVRAITGMRLPPSVEWVGPDGTVLESGENVTIGEVETRGTVSTISLFFHPVLSSQGGHYTCRATVDVPWMDVQPPQFSDTFNMVVTSQAMFQLKLYPLPHCNTWRLSEVRELEFYVRQKLSDIIREHCACSFNYYDNFGIYSGGFSCPTVACHQSNCSLVPHATYRAIIKGRNDRLTADQLMDILKEWHESSSSLLVSSLRLKVARSKKCKIRVSSFDEEEC